MLSTRADTAKVRVTSGTNDIQLQFSGLSSNRVYEIQASTNLVNWKGLSQRAGRDGTILFTDAQAGQFSQRFYRAVPLDLTGLGEDDFAPEKVLVKPRAGVSLSALNLTLGVHVLSVYPAIGNLQVIQVPSSMTSSTLIALYQQSGLAQYAEHDFYVRALAAPDDFYYAQGNLWGLHNYGQFGGKTNADIDAPEAWDIQHDASNIIVAVVDTGVRYTHEDLAANMWVNPADGSHGTNVVAGNTDPGDDYGHGTHVAGTIGAVGNNEIGVVGVAWRVQIMACKFLDATGNGTIDGAIACLDYARAHGAKIVNASWGASSFTSQALHDAIASLRDAGILFVAAAGNSGADNDVAPVYPASYSDLDNVISVAASDPSDTLTSWSDYGATNVDLAAPGAEIFSCWNGSNSDYQYDDGTSMACAMVSGAAAVMEAHFPDDGYQQIKQQLLANVDPLPSLQGKCISGGRLNLYKALTGGAAPPPLTASFTAIPSSGQAPLTVQFTDTSTGNPTSWDWSFGDGSADSPAQNPSHTYTNAGSYTATLTVTGSGGQTSSASQTLAVTNGSSSSLPVITLAATQPDAYVSGQVPGVVRFHRTGDTSQAYEVYWTFSGTASNGVDYGPLPTDSPFPAGQADADLTITPINHGQTNDQTVIVTLAPGSAYQIGASNSATVTIHGASSGPVADFTANPASGPAPLTVQFTDTSSGSPTSWDWTFGDGTPDSSMQNPAHTYTNAGNFTATLTVTGSSGQTSSKSETITVTNAPAPVTAGFSANPTSGQAPLGVQFNDQSSGPVSSWSWNFGDGSTSTAQNPFHTYNNAGSYTATLTVTGSSGQTSSAGQTITVTNAPPPPSSSTVTVVVSQPLATSLTPGVFTISRSGDTTSSLAVYYSLGGTAQNGVDYQTLPGVATIAAGSSSASVVVQPLGLVNVLKTVVLTISPDSSYTVGSPGSATVTIVVSLSL
ncbi:MAG: S8 family serine peptidase [Verrucomicrobiota bacterium]|nr:S8 family serine peptidase [Verrucomicrobiota bacterium]